MIAFDHFGLWYDQPIVLIDTETTGYAATRGDRIVEIAAVRLERLKIVGQWHSFINPERSIPDEASKVHLIYDEDVALAPRFADKAPELVSFCAGALPGAYKEAFDRGFILAEMWECGIGHTELTLWPRWIDPLTWVRSVDRFATEKVDNSLASACARRGISVHGAHGAVADATATGLLLAELAGDMPRCTGSELLRRQGLLGTASSRRMEAAKIAGRLQ